MLKFQSLAVLICLSPWLMSRAKCGLIFEMTSTVNCTYQGEGKQDSHIHVQLVENFKTMIVLRLHKINYGKLLGSKLLFSALSRLR